MRRKQNRRQPKPGRKRYDINMIRDFLTQLGHELKADVFDTTTSRPGTIHPELGEPIGRFIRKYKASTILPTILVDDIGDEEKCAYLHAAFRKAMAKLRLEQLHAWEALQPLFQEALLAARHNVDNGGMRGRQVLASKLVERLSPFDTDDGDDFENRTEG